MKKRDRAIIVDIFSGILGRNGNEPVSGIFGTVYNQDCFGEYHFFLQIVNQRPTTTVNERTFLKTASFLVNNELYESLIKIKYSPVFITVIKKTYF